MKKIVSTALVLSLAFVGTASAGFKYTPSVNVDTVNRSASGALGTARNSADTLQYVSCQVNAFKNGAVDTTMITCVARNALGTTAACSLVNPSANYLEALRSVNGDSSIYFGWDASGACTTLAVGNASYYEPKQ